MRVQHVAAEGGPAAERAHVGGLGRRQIGIVGGDLVADVDTVADLERVGSDGAVGDRIHRHAAGEPAFQRTGDAVAHREVVVCEARVLAHVGLHGGGLVGSHRIGVAALLEAEEAGPGGVVALRERHERATRSIELHQGRARIDADAGDGEARDQDAGRGLVRRGAARTQDVVRLAVAGPHIEVRIGEQRIVGGAPGAHVRADAD